MNIAKILAEKATLSGWLNYPAYYSPPDIVWTHGKVHDIAACASGLLRARGIGPGSRVLILLPDSVSWITTFLAVARLGAVAVLANPDLPAKDHRLLVGDCVPDCYVCPEELATRFPHRHTITDVELLTQAMAAHPAPFYPSRAEDPLYIQYTSGTTGMPKGAVHRHGDIPVYHRSVADEMLGIVANDVSFSVSKLFFAYGFGNSFVYPLMSGSSAVLMPRRPSAAETAELISRYKVTLLHGVPSMYARLITETESRNYRSVRAAVSAGEQLPPELGGACEELFRAPVLDELGSTEVGGAFCANTLRRHALGTVGEPLEGYRLQIRGEEGQLLPPGDEGELWVAGPTLIREYFRQPDAAARILHNGWLRTGDRATLRDDGRYVHRGRSDDIEMVGGIKVSPQEIEAVLREHQAVRDAAVAVVKDSHAIGRLRGYVVLVASGVAPSATEALEGELLSLARSRLAPFKVPRSIRVVTSLPRTATGKLRRFALREGYLEQIDTRPDSIPSQTGLG